MSRFARGPGLPRSVRDRVSGRPLAAAQAVDGTWLVGTRSALEVVAGDVRVVAWESVEHADWGLETSTLSVTEVQDFGEPVSACTFELSEPGSLPALVRERVTASIVVRRRVDLFGRRGFTVVGRRSPTGSGPLTWAFELDPGVDPDDPAVRTAAEAALLETQDSVGL